MAAAGAAGASGGGSSGEGVRAFRSLAGYIFGGNQVCGWMGVLPCVCWG